VTFRNFERTGKRRVTQLSSIARKVENVRGIDIDYVQYCCLCLRPTAFCESKRVLVSDREWEYVRNHAAFYGDNCYALLVIERQHDIGVKYFDSNTGEIYGPKFGGEEILIFVLEKARDKHKCPDARTDSAHASAENASQRTR
jgi:hypothetical protein